MSIVRNFNLYLNAGNGSAPYINANQYDQGEQWVFTLYKEDGTKYTPSTGAIVGIKADNRGIINTGTVDADGRVVINETQQMTAAAGIAIFELLIDGDSHGTANFLVNVEQRPGDNADLSDSDLSLIQQAVDSAAEIEDLLGGQDVPTVITPIISDWLDENITNPSNPPIDTSLTVAGAAADAKTTGDEITDLKSALNLGAAKLVVSNTVSQLDAVNAVPFFAEGGDVITFSTVDGSTFAAQRIRFLNADKNNVAYWTLLTHLSTQSVTFPTGISAVYWVMIEGGTAQEISVLNKTKDKISAVETIAKNAESDTHLIAESSIYRANVWTTGIYIPFFAEPGDTIKFETVSGESFTGPANAQVNFHNKEKTLIGYWGIGAAYGNSRTVTYSLSAPSAYVSLLNTTDNVLVTNITRGNFLIYTPQRNGMVEKYITNDTKNDRKNVEKNADKTFVFFSDIHGASVCGQRVFEFANAVNANAIINGGDLVAAWINENIDWYNSALTASDVDALMCIGNHDAWVSNWTMASSTDIYSKFIAPMVAKVQNVIQPSGASQNGLCYYYKDYDSIRVIVLAAMSSTNQSMLWTSEQLTWFENALDDAKTNQKSVICVNHAPFGKASADIDYDSQLNSWVNYRTFSGYDSIHLNDEAVAAVESFISDGGEFICWLTGHTHADYIMKNGNQAAIVISTARYDRHFDGYSPTSASAIEETNYDCFDYIGVDTTNKMVKVWRIGCNGDAAMKVRNRFSYDYANRKIIANS